MAQSHLQCDLCYTLGMRVGWFGPTKQKLSCGGSVLASEVQAGLFLGRRDSIRVGYTWIEVWGGCSGVRHKGGVGLGQKKQKLLAPQLSAYKTYMISICILMYLPLCAFQPLFMLPALICTPQLSFVHVCAISLLLLQCVCSTPTDSDAAGSSMVVAIAGLCMHTLPPSVPHVHVLSHTCCCGYSFMEAFPAATIAAAHTCTLLLTSPLVHVCLLAPNSLLFVIPYL